jgi:integrase
MSLKKIEAIRYFKTFNVGHWLSAKIYNDSKDNCQKCGGEFSKRSDAFGIEIPVCAVCGAPPALFRIRAKVKGIDGKVKYIDVRHSKNGERLTKPYECMTILDRINEDLEAGRFNIRHYESKKVRDDYLFENIVQEYLDFHKKRLDRGDITPYGFKHKIKYCKVLMKTFAGQDIATITKPKIEQFKNSFTEHLTNRDKGLSELRTILKFTHDTLEKIDKVPSFDPIPASNVRKEVLTIEQAREIIPHIENPMYRLMIELLSVYAIRPCEVRAIQYRDIDLPGNALLIQRHFSGSKCIDGRKSVKTGDKRQVPFMLIPQLRDYVLMQPTPLNDEEFVFKSPNNNPVFENTLPKAWARTLKKLGLPHVQMYEIRHARGTEILVQSNGNMVMARDFLGHTNLATTERRYAKPKVNNDQFIENVLPISC